MFNNPPHAARWQPPPPLPPQASHATLCSLRGESRPHPLRQNPPSIRESFDEAVFEDIGLAPPPSALTSTHYDPEPSPLDDYNSATRGHQRSLTDTFFENCRPLVTRATSSLQQTSKTSFHSPTKSLASFIPSRSAATTATSDAEAHAGQAKLRGTKIFIDWFNGSSAPVAVGVAPPSPTKDHADHTDDEEDEDEEQHEETEDTIAMPTHTLTRPPPGTRITTTTIPAATVAAKRPTSGTSNPTSKFSWLLNANKPSTPSQPTTSTTTTSTTNYHNPTDPLLTLSIPHALFPHDTIDPLAPSSFHDLLSTAEALLSRYQTSYRTLSTALADARAEQSALADELDEADTRVRCLKTQLADSAARAIEQDAQMARLTAELRREREGRREDEERRKRSVALVRGPACRSCAHSPLAREPVVVCAEEERETPRAAKRVSAGSCVSDSGFESEGESEAGSVFSRGQGAVSPVGTALSSVGSVADPEERERERERERTPITAPRPRPMQRRSTYDKVRAGLAHEVEGRGWGCANCEGGAQSAVWGRLAKEREQNGALKRRVQELEGAVEGCLDLVNGPWGLGGL